MARVALSDISKHYGDFAAVESLDLDVSEGEFIVLLGPSGCGKTTTLRMIAGFIEPTAGRIEIGDRDLTRFPAHKRNLGIVFQNYAIFPHLTVFENVAFGLRRRKAPAAVIEAKASQALRRVKLDHLRDRLPKQLSGGQQQRVAIARAIAIEPDAFLLDEPLSNLDAKLRLEVRGEIHSLQRDLGITTVMVTHDQEEALSLGDRLVVMNKGVVQQIGSARDIYEQPANLFVASFVGQANILRGTADGSGGFRTDSELVLKSRNTCPGASAVVVRPESILLHPASAVGERLIAATVSSVMYLGATCEVWLRLAASDPVVATIPAARAAEIDIRVDKAVKVEIAAGAAYALRNEG